MNIAGVRSVLSNCYYTSAPHLVDSTDRRSAFVSETLVVALFKVSLG